MMKFVLLAHSRSGSTLVAMALRQHRSIVMFGELFNDEEPERKRAFDFGASFRQARRIGCLSQRSKINYYTQSVDAAEFLQKEIFADHDWSEDSAIGFKMLYEQARESVNAITAWDYLLQNKDIHIIHLQRNNLLESYLSLRLAHMTGEWTIPESTATGVDGLNRILLDPVACQTYFDQTMALREQIRKNFSTHPILDIEYERDICAHFDTTMQEIQRFLDIPEQDLPQLIKKQAQQKPWEQIANYQDLRLFFRFTSYREFFFE